MEEKRFNPEKFEKLNNPERIKEFPAEYIVQLTAIENPEVIIDLGAGTAFFSVPFAKVYANCRIYACDISDIMIDWIKKNIIPEYKNINAMLISDNKIPLDNNIADLIFMVNLHHELDKPVETLKECYRLLKAGGIVAISDWRKEIMERGPSFEIRYNPEEVNRQLQEVGFLKIEMYQGFPNNFLVIARK